MIKHKIKLLLCLILVVLLLNVGAYAFTLQTLSELGSLEDWEPEKGYVSLDGDWEFFWNDFLSYEELQAVASKKTITVPASWSEYKTGELKLDSEGHATYRLRLKTGLEDGTYLGLYIKNLSSAYKVFINDMAVASLGVVSPNPEEVFVKSYPQAVFFAIPAAEFDIIIHTSSHKTFKSGLTSSLFLGSVDDIEALHNNSLLKYSILYGLLFIVMVFSIMMAIMCRDIKYFAFLSVLSVSFFVAVDLSSINLISKYLAALDISQAKVLLYSSINCCLILVTAYCYFQFKSGFYKTVLKLTLIMSILWQLSIVFMPIKLFEAAIFSIGKINLFSLYALTISLLNLAGIIKGARENFIGGMEQLLCASIFSISALIDYSYYRGNLSVLPFPVLHYSLMIILVVQMVIQAKQVRGLIEQQRSEELKFMQAQVKPHLLYDVIDTYISISKQDIEKARTILEAFADYLRKTFDIKQSYRYYSLREAISLLQSYINIEQIRLKNSLEVNFELPENLDVAIPTYMLQPIVENAIVHGLSKKGKGGRLDIIIERCGPYLYFTVKDNGAGMTPEEISKAIDPNRNNSLSNISKRLSSLNRKFLSIVSSPNIGTEVSWRVRVKELKN